MKKEGVRCQSKQKTKRQNAGDCSPIHLVQVTEEKDDRGSKVGSTVVISVDGCFVPLRLMSDGVILDAFLEAVAGTDSDSRDQETELCTGHQLAFGVGRVPLKHHLDQMVKNTKYIRLK